MLPLLMILSTATAGDDAPPPSGVPSDCSYVTDEDNTPAWMISNATECGDDVCLGNEWFREGSYEGSEGRCGTLGPYGGGCISVDDCPAFYDGYLLNDQVMPPVCKNGQCKLGNGAPCDFEIGLEPPEMVLLHGVDIGYEYDPCASGLCIVHFRQDATCQKFLNYTEGCTTDAECGVNVPGTEQSMVCHDGQCKLAHGSVCSDWDYGLVGVDLEVCAGGFCMSDSILQAEPACRSLGPNGTCTTNQDCNYNYFTQESTLSCIDSKCVVPEGEDCSLFDDYYKISGTDLNACQGGADCIDINGTYLCDDAPTMAPTTSAPTTTSPTTSAPTTTSPTTSAPTDAGTTVAGTIDFSSSPSVLPLAGLALLPLLAIL